MKNKFNNSDERYEFYDLATKLVESNSYLNIYDDDYLSELSQELIDKFATNAAYKITYHWTSINPFNSEAWLYHGLALSQKLNQESKAEKSFKKAISLDRANPENYIQLGILYEELDMNEDALACYLDAKKYSPRDSEIHHCIGSLFFSMSKYDNAISSFKECIKYNPEFSEAWLDLGIAYDFISSKDDALYAFKKYSELEPNVATGWELQGTLLSSIERYDDAIKCYDYAIKNSENPVYATYSKAILLLDMNKLNESMRTFFDVLGLVPNEPLSLFQIGSIYQIKEKHHVAIKYLAKCITHLKRQNYSSEIIADAWYTVSKSFDAINKLKSASFSKQMAIKLFPQKYKKTDSSKNTT